MHPKALLVAICLLLAAFELLRRFKRASRYVLAKPCQFVLLGGVGLGCLAIGVIVLGMAFT